MARRLSAVMFTDTVGYTASAQTDEGRTLDLLRQQAELLRPLLAIHQGREIKSTGDGFLVEFDSALKAVQCALNIQRRIYERNSEGGQVPIRIRIGVHLGDVVQTGTDILGDAVNIAARIEPLAEPGGVCVSAAVYEQVRSKVPDKFERLEPATLKGVQVPVEVYRVLLPWAGGDVQASRADESRTEDRTRVAVLPFASMSPDPADEYFADGITEELITTLSKIRELTVLARTTVMGYKSSSKRVAEVARELNAGRIVEGSVRKAGNRVRITVQLLDSATEGHLWAENYDRDLSDVFEIQSEVARKVTDALRVRMTPQEAIRTRRPSTRNEEAHLAYLKGRYRWNRRTPVEVTTAIGCFEQAIEFDPSYALAHAALADSYAILIDLGVAPPREAHAHARRHAERALELDPALGEAHASLANHLSTTYTDWARAEREFRAALELAPSYVVARHWFGLHLRVLGRFPEALEQYRFALDLDPFSPLVNAAYSVALIEAGKTSEGVDRMTRTIASDPGFALAHFMMGAALVQLGPLARSVDEFRSALEVVPGHPYFLMGLGRAYALSGQRAAAEGVLSELQERAADRYIPPMALGIVEYSLGNRKAAFRHLEEAAEEGSTMFHHLTSSPGWGDLRADPDFLAIVDRLTLRATRTAP